MKKTILWCLALLVLTPTLAQPQPAIRATDGILNASSFLPDVARGSWFVIFGTGLGPATISIQETLPYQAQLSGTSITFTPASGGTPVSALMYYTLATQAAGMLPSSTPAGAYNVTVTYNGQTSAAAPVNVVDHNFGFATQTSNGQGPAQATYGGYNLNRFTTGKLSPWTLQPAHPGDSMVLWGTGIGADPASDITGGSSGDQTASAQVSVLVSGISVTPAYAGRSTGSPGLDQINFTIPANVTPSCFVSLQVSAGGVLSNLGSIAVAPAGAAACASPMLTESQLQTLDQGGTLNVGSLHLGKTATTLTVSPYGTFTIDVQTAAGWFGKYAVDTVAGANFALVQSGACFLLHRTGTTDQIGFGLAPQSMNAGAHLMLNGPNASNMPIAQMSDESYNTMLYSSGLDGIGGSGSPTLGQGSYTLSGSGGPDIGAFSATVSLPGDFVWTNQKSIPNPIPRDAPLKVTWTGGEGGIVSIAGSALTQTGGTLPYATYSATIFECDAPASAGSFTIPSSMLEQLPAISSDPASGAFGTLALIATPDPAQHLGLFTASMTAGGSIDLGVLTYGVTYIQAVGFN